jgi:hypothetical protein
MGIKHKQNLELIYSNLQCQVVTNRIYKFNSNSPIASWLTWMLNFFKWLLLSSLSNTTQISHNLDNHTNGKYDPLEHLHHTPLNVLTSLSKP